MCIKRAVLFQRLEPICGEVPCDGETSLIAIESQLDREMAKSQKCWVLRQKKKRKNHH
jgi:hypothetical protein